MTPPEHPEDVEEDQEEQEERAQSSNKKNEISQRADYSDRLNCIDWKADVLVKPKFDWLGQQVWNARLNSVAKRSRWGNH